MMRVRVVTPPSLSFAFGVNEQRHEPSDHFHFDAIGEGCESFDVCAVSGQDGAAWFGQYDDEGVDR